MTTKKALLGLMIATTPLGMQAKQWTLRDCINYALENNISLQKTVLKKLVRKKTTSSRKQLCCLRCKQAPAKTSTIRHGWLAASVEMATPSHPSTRFITTAPIR